MTRRRDGVALALAIAVLAAYDVLRSAALPDAAHFPTNVAMIALVLAIGYSARLGRDELGLTRRALPAGLRVGGLAVLVIGVGVAVAALVMGADTAFVAERTDLDLREMLFQVAVEIPLATVLFEELAFRGVLGALLHRLASPRWAVAYGAVLFGLWHVPGAVAGGGSAIGAVAATMGTVVVTAVAGVVLQLMKDHTGSLAAPVLTHWATNGLTLLVVWLVAA